MTRLAAVLLAFLAILCPAAALAQGPAEITLPHTTAAQVRPQLVNLMLNRGYRVAGESQSLITFERPADNLGAMFLFGSRFNMVPLSRVSFSMAELGGSTRVMADVAVIGNPGSAFERRNDLNFGADREAAQAILGSLQLGADATGVGSPSSPSPNPEAVTHCGPRIKVLNGQLAEVDACR